MSYYILPKYVNSKTINIEIELSNESTVNTLINELGEIMVKVRSSITGIKKVWS